MIKDKLGFNFWPSFTDLMLSLVLVVLTILFVVSKIIAVGSENLDEARKSQHTIQSEIKQQLEPNYKVLIVGNDAVRNSEADIFIYDKLDRQTITFSDKVLFDSGKSEIKSEGYKLLEVVGPVIAKNLDNIVEIQIQGHADISYEDTYNLKLAADRAIAVYVFLQNNVGIDPSRYMMSATSFGKFKPIDRNQDSVFDYNKLEQANATDEMRARNRRIEIVLYFRNKKI